MDHLLSKEMGRSYHDLLFPILSNRYESILPKSSDYHILASDSPLKRLTDHHVCIRWNKFKIKAAFVFVTRRFFGTNFRFLICPEQLRKRHVDVRMFCYTRLMTNTSTTLNSPELEKYIYEILDWKFDSIADSLDNIVQTHKLSMENYNRAALKLDII